MDLPALLAKETVSETDVFGCREVSKTMAKRGHGEGSIYQRKDGRWAASISVEGGKRKTFYGATRKEVQEKLRIALNEQKQGILATGPQQTVKQYLEQWFEDVHKPTLRITSYARYGTLLRKHILPVIGHIQLQKLTAQQVQALYTRKVKEGMAPKTIQNIHGLLHKALDNALKWGLVPRNVCDAVSTPRLAHHEIHPLTKEQAQQLVEEIRGHQLEALIVVALVTGMRQGELFALRWQDISFDDKTLQVCRTVSHLTRFGYVENEPKTSRGRRMIVLPAFIIDLLKQHRERQAQARLKAGNKWIDKGLVFCNTHGDYLHPDYLMLRFHRLFDELGLPRIRFHDLRHSAATILLSIGIHPKVVQELLGHSQIGMTLDIYSHVLPSLQKEAMGKLDELFRRDKQDKDNEEQANN
ncbi:MAG: tyrosine-type recombinase/integrase [Ktedonobacteraceae bacterium]